MKSNIYKLLTNTQIEFTITYLLNIKYNINRLVESVYNGQHDK